MSTKKEKQGTAQQSENQGTTQQPQQSLQSGQGQSSQGQSGQGQTGMARREPSTSTLPSLFTASPFSFMRRFSEEMDRLFEDFGFGGGRGLSQRGTSAFGGSMFMPQIEVAQRGNQIVVHADLPGLSKDDVHIDVTDEGLIISGERRQQHEDRQQGYYRSERSYGSFRRLIPLPETANLEGANATFNNGVLEITIPNEQQQPRGRRIEIQDAAQSGSSEQQQASAQAAGQQK